MLTPRERERFVDFLRERGLRVTASRLAVLEEIFSQHGHIDVEQLRQGLEEKGAKASRATVYRTLDLLVESGMVRRYHLGRDHQHYEHIHAGQQHEHLICTDCGRVVEFVSPGIAALQREICRAHDFEPRHHNLQIFGLCRACAQRSPESRETRA